MPRHFARPVGDRHRVSGQGSPSVIAPRRSFSVCRTRC